MRLTLANLVVSVIAALTLAGLASAAVNEMIPSDAASNASSMLCGFSAMTVGFFSFAIPFEKQAAALQRTWIWRFSGLVRTLLQSQKWRPSSIAWFVIGATLLVTKLAQAI